MSRTASLPEKRPRAGMSKAGHKSLLPDGTYQGIFALEAELTKTDIQRNAPIAPLTTFRIGGPAEILLEATEDGDLPRICRWVSEQDVPITILGHGSNILVSDDGISGVVVVNRVRGICIRSEDSLTVAAGESLGDLVNGTVEMSWEGLEVLAGIPGSVGGAVCGNAGAYGRCIGEFVRSARVVDSDGIVRNVDADFFEFEYRSSILKKNSFCLLDVELGGLVSGHREKMLEKMADIQEKRWEKLPGPEVPCAGSFFKNLPPEEPGGRRRSIGKYLDEAGAKELRVGDAGVYPSHANVIVNLGSATANDVLLLAKKMASLLKDKFDIQAEPEVRFIGPGLEWNAD